MNLKHLSDEQLLDCTLALANQERKITSSLLWHIRAVEDRKLYLEFGHECNSIFDYIVKILKFSDGCARRRMNAARLLSFVPEVAEKIADGKINLTAAALTQDVMKLHEKTHGKISDAWKAAIVEQIENKSTRMVERILAQELPEAARQVEVKYKEKSKALVGDKTLMSFVFDKETTDLLKRAQEILSYSCPGSSDVIKRALKDLVDRIDPLKQKTTSQSEVVVTTHRKTSASAKRFVFQRAESACEFVDPLTRKICGERKFLQIDHVIPIALGGDNSPEKSSCL